MSDEVATRGPSAAAVPPFLKTPLGVALVVLAFGTAYSTIRILASSAIGTDDAWENVYVQSLRPGYILSQPPLYEWILWAVQQGLGTGVQSFLAVKFGLMALSAVFLFGAARFAIRDDATAAVATFSYALFYQIGWNMLEGVTHTAVLFCACAATTFTLSRAVRTGRWVDHVWLGLALGTGALSKFGYPLFAGSLVAAFLSEPLLRRRLKPARLALSVGIALVVASPFLYWVVAGERPVLGAVADIMTEGARQPHLVRAGTGIAKLGLSLLGFAVPLLPLVALLFWRPLLRRAPGEDALSDAYARAYGRAILIAIGVAILAVLATGASRLRERHMHPLLILLPIWLFARIERGGVPGRRIRVFRSTILATVALVLAVRVAGLLAPDAMFCGRTCRPAKPYADLIAGLRAIGAGGTLIGLDRYTAGNLRVGFPEARIVMATEPLGFPEASRPPGPCWIVWEAGRKAELPFDQAAEREKRNPNEWPAIEPDRFVIGQWRHLWKPPGFRTIGWGVRRVDPSSASCLGGNPGSAPVGEEIASSSSPGS